VGGVFDETTGRGRLGGRGGGLRNIGSLELGAAVEKNEVTLSFPLGSWFAVTPRLTMHPPTLVILIRLQLFQRKSRRQDGSFGQSCARQCADAPVQKQSAKSFCTKICRLTGTKCPEETCRRHLEPKRGSLEVCFGNLTLRA
jgi:hypothetical protein